MIFYFYFNYKFILFKRIIIFVYRYIKSNEWFIKKRDYTVPTRIK